MLSRLFSLLACFSGLMLMPLHAVAQWNYSGTTLGGPKFHRPVSNGYGPPNRLSSVGTNVPYHQHAIVPTVSGNYSVVVTSETPRFDLYTCLYSGSVDVTDPLKNVLRAIDDLNMDSPRQSGFIAYLNADTPYSLVTTGFDNGDAGNFTVTIIPVEHQALSSTTLGEPTFQRPDDKSNDETPDNGEELPDTLSEVGTAVPYKVFALRPIQTGYYNLVTTTLSTTPTYDHFTLLYSDQFNPADPLQNVLCANDDYITSDLSGTFNLLLLAGKVYYLVVTGYENTAAGDFQVNVYGSAPFLLQSTTSISGRVVLVSSLTSAVPTAFTFRPTDGTPSFSFSVLPEEDGTFTIPYVPTTVYDLAVKSERNLQKVVSVDTSGGSVENIHLELLGGDADNSNSVDILDLGTLAEDFNSTPGEAHWHEGRADFNYDNSVDIFDLVILATNFNTVGDP